MTEAKEPAYPVSKERAEQYTDNPAFGFGLTKREYFAGLAMQGIMANREIMRTIAKLEKLDKHEWVAKSAVNFADKLISELSKPQP